MEDNKIRILLVEDNEEHAEIVRRAFESCDMNSTLTVAQNLDKARACLVASNPHIMVTDFLLPDGKGLELLSPATAASNYPVIVMTSFGDEQVAVEAIKAGALDYVAKSESSLLDMPHIAERALREWDHIQKRKRAEEERRNLEKQLVRAQKLEAIGTLAGGIAHDFNNILGAIIGYTELALFEVESDSIGANNMNQVLKASHRAKDLVKQILAFSRKDKRDKESVRLDLIAKEALKLLRASLPVSITIHQEIDENVGPILGDHSQIHQVIMNLCTNAWHAMEENGGTLSLYLAEVNVTGEDLVQFPDADLGAHVKLNIKDTGAGMPKEVMDRIFDPYFTTKGQGKGTGLGLSIVHGIVRRHGGHIKVWSKPQNGTTFEILFPLSKKQGMSEKKGTAQPLGGTERILFVDDEKALSDLGEKILTYLGYKVLTTQNPAEALEIFSAAPDEFDLVITDMAMPGMNGRRLAEKLREIRPDIPLLLCTGFSDELDQKNIHSIGIQAMLMKPLTIEKLSKTVRKVLDEI
jgi:signal transduction histidine kinase